MAQTSEEEDAQAKVQACLKACGQGSILRGWRRELDPDGSLDCNFLEFCQAAKRLRLAVDIMKLFGADSPDSLELREVMPSMGDLVDRFRDWMVKEHGGPSEMCLAFETAEEQHSGVVGDGLIRIDGFGRGCDALGFEATTEEKEELFALLDSEYQGAVAAEDVMFLEVDVKKREGALKKGQEKRNAQHIKELTAAYREDTSNPLPWHHRRAARPWQAAMFEQLPALLCEKKLHHRAEEHRRRAEARAKFIVHINEAFGDPVRAWRCGLDTENRYVVTRPVLSKYCSANGLRINFADLWKAFDLDGDGVIRLEEVGPSHSAIFANLQAWCRQMFGSCAAIWVTPEADDIRAEYQGKGLWRSDKKMPLKAFGRLLGDIGWPLLARPNIPEPQILLKGLDFYNCGFLSVKDLMWLDSWEAPPWLSAEPDEEAWKQLLSRMMSIHQQPLRAWRRCLDTDDSNCVSYVEFQQAVKSVKFTGNVDGAWRWLDKDISGTISLTEFDPDSARLLQSFKEWMEQNFGAVEAAFRAMDSDGSGALSFSELKRACKRAPWDEDVGLLFDCLAIPKQPGRRTLSFKDLEFLDYWMPESIEETVDKAMAESQAKAALEKQERQKHGFSPRHASASPRRQHPPSPDATAAASKALKRRSESEALLPRIAQADASQQTAHSGASRGARKDRVPEQYTQKATTKQDLQRAYSVQAPAKGWFPPYLLSPATPDKGLKQVASLPSVRNHGAQDAAQSHASSAKAARRHDRWGH